MQKIMFNDKCFLTDAVLEGRKTMTRRVVKQLIGVTDPDISEWGFDDKGKAMVCLYADGKPTADIYPMYQPGEIVAVAQSYRTLEKEIRSLGLPLDLKEDIVKHKGYTNKMFVKPADMPHRIEITNVKIERLQDISDEDCFREGITSITEGRREIGNAYGWDTRIDVLKRDSFFKPRAAFAALIDKAGEKGTWKSNPWVFAYSFKVIA